MFKSVSKCSLCGEMGDRDDMILYHFPDGVRLVCKTCYKQLPPDVSRIIRRPDGRKRRPNDDIFPPID